MSVCPSVSQLDSIQIIVSNRWYDLYGIVLIVCKYMAHLRRPFKQTQICFCWFSSFFFGCLLIISFLFFACHSLGYLLGLTYLKNFATISTRFLHNLFVFLVIPLDAMWPREATLEISKRLYSPHITDSEELVKKTKEPPSCREGQYYTITPVIWSGTIIL